MSSPRLNNTIVIGCITMYLSVFLFGLDGNLVSTGRYSANCQARIWLASLGFITAFGSMFAKIWRVYVIFTNRKLRKKVRVLFPPQRPLSCCFGSKGFLAVDLGRGKKGSARGMPGIPRYCHATWLPCKTSVLFQNFP